MIHDSSRKHVIVLLVAVLTWGTPALSDAYLQFGVQIGDRPIPLKWNRLPVRYFVTDRDVPGVSASQLRGAADRAFSTWRSVPPATLSAQFVGFVGADPFDEDGATTIGFQERPELERVLAATSFVIDTTTGDLVESGIFLNSAFSWSVADQGEPGRFDVESIALHEIGHLFGLSHSALGETELRPEGGRRVIAAEAVMFPIAFAAGNIAGRTLKADDVAGIADLYPQPSFTRETGTLSGRVTKNGRGVRGAHIVAFNPKDGSLVGGFSLTNEGEFTIGGLSPGPHIVRVEPLDDANIDSFFGTISSIDFEFKVAFADRLAIVPRGGTSASIEIKVVPK